MRPKREEIWKSRPQIIDFTAPPGDPEVEECPGGDGEKEKRNGFQAGEMRGLESFFPFEIPEDHSPCYLLLLSEHSSKSAATPLGVTRQPLIAG